MISSEGRRVTGRLLGGSGSLLLVACFFLPMIKGCSGPESPRSISFSRAEDAFQNLLERKITESTLERVGMALGIPLAHLFGLVILLRILASAWRPRGGVDRVVRVLVELQLVLALVVLNGYMLGWAGKYFGSSSHWDRFYTALTWVLAVLVLGWLVWARVKRWSHERFVLAVQQVGGLLCLIWFQYWLVGKAVRSVKNGSPPFDEVYYGLPLAALGSLLVAIGGALEGMARGGRAPRPGPGTAEAGSEATVHPGGGAGDGPPMAAPGTGA